MDRKRYIYDTHDTDNSRFLRHTLRSPCKVPAVQSQGAVLEVSTTYTNGTNPLSTELGVSRLTTELELSLLAIVGTLGSGRRALVAGRARNTYIKWSAWI